MVDILRGGGLSCGLCGTLPPTTTRQAPLIQRSRLVWKLRDDRRTHKLQHDVPRACEGADGPGSGTGLSAGSPSSQCSSKTRRHRCKLLRTTNNPGGCLATAVHFACKDARLMTAAAQNLDERARSDIAILAKGILRMDMRARQDVALIGSSFLKLDARAREDTEKLDTQAREKVKRLRRIALGLQEIARVEAEEHWNDGALDADLRLIDLRARRRAMEDAYVSLQVVKMVQSSLVSILRMREIELRPDGKSESTATKDTKHTTGSVALDRLLELEEAYLSMASLLVEEADGIDCTDPDELELVVATLLDMDEVTGGSGASLLAECATSPDVATRRALADALAAAPSLWSLGNAGMGALQRLATDSNPAVAAAAAKAIEEFNQQWSVEYNNTIHFPRTSLPQDSVEPIDESEDI